MAIQAAPKIPASRRANKAEAAEFFGVSLPTINAWISKGAPVLQKGSRGIPWVLDLLAIAEWRFTGGAGVADDDVPQTPRERKDWYESELKRLEYEQRTGLLLATDDARVTWAEALKSIMLSLDTLSDVVERDAGLSPEQAVIVQRVVDQQREALYADMTASEELEASDG